VTDAIKAVRKDGRIVLIGLKRGEPLEQAIRTLAGDVPGADAIGVSVEPERA
jgi:hypothetical protein